MNANDQSLIVDGTYFWQPIFELDYSKEKTSYFEKKVSYKISTEVRTREFLSSTFKVDSGFKFDSKFSVGLKYEGVEVGTELGYSLHEEWSRALVASSETGEEIKKEYEETNTWRVGPGDKLAMYQLCYRTVGGEVQSTTISTSKSADVIVKLKYGCTTYILGLASILDLFSQTRPQSSNLSEWSTIRNDITAWSAASDTERFKQFVKVLDSIHPGSENVAEWADIRRTCSEILHDWDTTTVKQNLFTKLLYRFGQTYPGSSNKDEWARIRDQSNKVISGVTQVWPSS